MQKNAKKNQELKILESRTSIKMLSLWIGYLSSWIVIVFIKATIDYSGIHFTFSYIPFSFICTLSGIAMNSYLVKTYEMILFV